MKFGMLTHIGHLQRTDREVFEFSKIPGGSGHRLETHKKSQYLSNGLTGLRQIWRADAKWVT